MDKNLFKYKNSKRTLTTVGVITVFQTIAIIIQAIYLGKAIITIYEGANWSVALSFFSIFLTAHISRHFLQWLKSRVTYKFAEETASQLQRQFVEKVFALGPKPITKFGSGNIITLCLEGISNFRTYLELFIPRFLACLITPVGILIYVFYTDLLSGVIFIVVMPILIVFLILLGLVAKRQKDKKWANYLMLSRHFVDSLRGLVTLKFLGRSKGHRDAIYDVSNKYRISTIRTLRIAFLSTFSLDFFSSLSIAVISVELGLRLINGNMEFLDALIILILAPEYFTPVRELGNDYHATMDGKEAGKKIHQVLETADERTNLADVPLPFWNGQSELKVTDLTKVYSEEGRTVLDQINFSVKGYQKVGIIGLSGAGKSSLIDVLSGFTGFTSGLVEINGKKIPAFTIPSWQKQITYIPQHPYIFSGTVAENIAWYQPDATEEEILEAARKTGLMPLIRELPGGLNEQIGQGGRALSGGEEQRIALARALLTKRPVMFFDEPTAHLDIETEHEIKEMMLPLMENKLVFFATHRLHWMNDMDYVLVIDRGRLVEQGTPEELLRKNGAFVRLIEAQRGRVEHESIPKIYTT